MLFLGYSTGMRIRYFRKKAGLTQKELAEKIGLSDSALRNYELGNRKPDRDTLTCIADALQVSYYALSMYDMSEINRTLHFLFEMEEMYQLKPGVIDGELVLRFDTKRLRELFGDNPFAMEDPDLSDHLETHSIWRIISGTGMMHILIIRKAGLIRKHMRTGNSNIRPLQASTRMALQ